MKAGELIDLLMHYSDDTTADIALVEDACGPVFRIDVEAEKLRKFLR